MTEGKIPLGKPRDGCTELAVVNLQFTLCCLELHGSALSPYILLPKQQEQESPYGLPVVLDPLLCSHTVALPARAGGCC